MFKIVRESSQSIKSCKLIGWKESRTVRDKEGLALRGQVLGWILDLIAITLSTKKVRNLLQSLVENHGNV